MRDEDLVIIAGAGPVGLVAANVLADAGIPVIVLEAQPQLPRTLRASTFHPPTLDMLSRFGVAQPLIDMGLIAPAVQYRDRAGWLAQFDFSLIGDLTRHPFRLQCDQYKLTALLAQRLGRLPNAHIAFSSPVVGITQSGDSVSATVEGPAGIRTFSGRWLIGADGGRSCVRDALKIRFEGFTWPERFLVVSTPFDFSKVIPNLCAVTYIADCKEWCFLLQVAGLWRVMFGIREEEKDADITAADAIERRLQGVWPKAGDYEVIHTTLYAVHQRVAESYRSGRAFLAGDAAHLNNPLGGMGMNGGIHDAFNLADKLVEVMRGQAEPCELDRYERQRRPIALEYVNTISSNNKRNLETADVDERTRWQEKMTRTAENPALARDYLTTISMIASLKKAELIV